MILAQSAATSRAYAMKYGDSFDENVDLVGLGLANAAAGCPGTFVVNGSPTKTSMVDNAGGRSQIAQLTTGVGGPRRPPVPDRPAVLHAERGPGAVVFLIGVRLIDVKGMSEITACARASSRSPLLTAATVVIVGVEQGILLAIFLSIVEHIYHSYRPYDTLISIAPDRRVIFTPYDSGQQAAPGLAVYRFGASLYYANATRFTAEITRDPRQGRSAAPLVLPVGLGHRRHRLLWCRRDPGSRRGSSTSAASRLPSPRRAMRFAASSTCTG